MIKAEIVAHSLSPQGDELISVLCTFPRIILAEVNTHRMLSKNTSSSRAIPFSKMIEAIESNPFIPIAWQRNHSGMQGSEYLIKQEDIEKARKWWLGARNFAIEQARELNQDIDVTKQLANRLLEPFMWTTMLITGSRLSWENFFKLRCPVYTLDFNAAGEISFRSKKEVTEFLDNFNEQVTDVYYSRSRTHKKFLEDPNNWYKINKGQAEIHIMDLAEKIWDALNESQPKKLKAGEWHIPFHGSINISSMIEENNLEDFGKIPYKVKISTAMAARTSYTIVGDEKEINYEKMVGLHDKLLSQDPPHSSPLEHCARAMSETEYTSSVSHGKSSKGKGSESYGWCNNFKGFIQYRYLIDNGIAI